MTDFLLHPHGRRRLGVFHSTCCYCGAKESRFPFQRVFLKVSWFRGEDEYLGIFCNDCISKGIPARVEFINVNGVEYRAVIINPYGSVKNPSFYSNQLFNPEHKFSDDLGFVHYELLKGQENKGKTKRYKQTKKRAVR